MLRRTLVRAGLSTAAMLMATTIAWAEDMPYNLLPGKPFAGTTLNILSVVTPQFDGLMLRTTNSPN